jgi:excisionase family DNA binding protein
MLAVNYSRDRTRTCEILQRKECVQMLTDPIAFSRREAADALRVSLRTIDYLLAQGKLRGRRIGRRVVIPRAEVEKLLRQDTPIVQGIENAS